MKRFAIIMRDAHSDVPKASVWEVPADGCAFSSARATFLIRRNQTANLSTYFQTFIHLSVGGPDACHISD